MNETKYSHDKGSVDPTVKFVLGWSFIVIPNGGKTGPVYRYPTEQFAKDCL